LQTRQWEAKDGSGKRQRTEIIMSEMQFLGGRGAEGGEYAGAGASNAGGAVADMPAAPIDDEDIPF
jgi:single-stranded DNA-binding protein